ncbi:MAG: zinc ABC transporter substrate-binding protein, partial [Pseudomonadota bacterium]
MVRRTGFLTAFHSAAALVSASVIGLVLIATPATAKKFTAVTTFTVLQDMAQAVAGDAATVLSITQPGAEIHDYQPTPQDIVKVQRADLVIWNGLNLERWFERFFARVQDVPSVVISDGVEPLGIAQGPY